LSDDEITTKDNQEFMTIMEKKVADNHILVADHMIQKRGSPLISNIKEG
jgi:hypothetical protein